MRSSLVRRRVAPSLPTAPSAPNSAKTPILPLDSVQDTRCHPRSYTVDFIHYVGHIESRREVGGSDLKKILLGLIKNGGKASLFT